MNARALHLAVWKYGGKIIRGFLEHKFHYSHEAFNPEKPCLIIANHVTNWDPLLMAISFPKHHMYFVASEHLFRKGIITKVISLLAAPIARRKGSTGTDTAMACLRHIRKGHSVCIFGEGEITWNGLSTASFAGTGSLARACGAPLVTFRFEGGYLSHPRWAKHGRKGKMHGHVVRVYSPEELKAMTADEISAVIDRDTFEDAWARQAKAPVPFKGRAQAKHIESGIFLCPSCRRIDTIRGKGHTAACACGFRVRCTEYGYFDPPKPFENFLQWDMWQHEQLQKGEFVQESPLFADRDISLIEITADHKTIPMAQGEITLEDQVLRMMSFSFDLHAIDHMAIVKTNLLLFSCEGRYYEMHAKGAVNFRKYLAMWKHIHSQSHERS